jgi:hypothetical protein
MSIPTFTAIALALFMTCTLWGGVAHRVLDGPLPIVFAQINSNAIDASTLAFLAFVQRLLILPALALGVWAAWCFHDNKIKEAILSLVSAFLCAVAVPIVKALFGV